MAKLPGGERRIVVETTCATTKAGFEEAFSKFDRSWPVIFETGTHCRWMNKCFRALGFKDIIANPGKIPSITKSNKKNDRNDARDVGAYLGLVPQQDQSGEVDKQLHITHAGSDICRTALVECAGVAMMSNAPDTDIKLKGLRISMHGGKIAKRKAKVAVARSLAVTIVALLKDMTKEYIPLSKAGGFKRYHAELEYLTMQKAAKKEKAEKKAKAA